MGDFNDLYCNQMSAKTLLVRQCHLRGTLNEYCDCEIFLTPLLLASAVCSAKTEILLRPPNI